MLILLRGVYRGRERERWPPVTVTYINTILLASSFGWLVFLFGLCLGFCFVWWCCLRGFVTAAVCFALSLCFRLAFLDNTVYYFVVVALLCYLFRLSSCGCCFCMLVPVMLYVICFPKASRLGCLNSYVFYCVLALSVMFPNEPFINKNVPKQKLWNVNPEVGFQQRSSKTTWKQKLQTQTYKTKTVMSTFRIGSCNFKPMQQKF